MTIVELPRRTPPVSGRLAGLPVAVIGAGPVGLAAAAQLLERGLDVVVFEVGDSAGAAVQAWGHTRLFTPWEFLIDEAAARLLDTAGWDAPAAKRLPHGRDLVSDYLLPLAATPELASRIQYNSTVTAVSRQGLDRTRSTGRADVPFLIRVQAPTGSTQHVARAVIDASGTYASPNGLLSSGLQPSAATVSANISHALPDVLGVERDRFAGKHVLVVGAGHSAANTLLKLAELAKEAPGTRVTWVVRSASPTRVYGSAADELEARGELGALMQDLVHSGQVALVDSFEIDDIRPVDGGRVAVVGRRGRSDATIEADIVVNATGFRPDLDMLREIRLNLDEIVEAPARLATLIDPNLHSCGSVEPHGVDELTHPEPHFYIAGMKSYGRAPTFLLLTGYEQVRSIADELAGNAEAARVVQLTLPETGLCSTALPTPDGALPLLDVSAGGSCGIAPAAASSCCGS